METRKSRNAVGIDAGATLWKLFSHESAEMEIFPAGAVEGLKHHIAQWTPSKVGITGAQASLISTALNSTESCLVNEFFAWGLGAPMLAKRGSMLLSQHYLLVSLGTGTSILEIKKTETKRISGSTFGGGTLLGLSKLLGLSHSFSELLTLASQGERQRVDLLVRDICQSGGYAPLSCDETVSAFGKLDSREPADLAHALIWLTGENIGILCNTIVRFVETRTVVFGGGALAGNEILKLALAKTLMSRGNDALFLPDGAFCGAAGAASFAQRSQYEFL